MSIFNRKSAAIMNVIRCDEPSYLVWKWRPEGASGNRENSIRWGSPLRVKDGEMAVFFYKQNNGIEQDFIVGPYDGKLRTDSFPVLASLQALAYGGDAPVQAEVYFFNLQRNNQTRFAVPYFDVFDSRLPDIGVPVAARGMVTFALEDYREFIRLNRLRDVSLEEFNQQVAAAVKRKVTSVIGMLPTQMGMPIFQLKNKMDVISEMITPQIEQIMSEFGVKLMRFDISDIDMDETSVGYQQVYQLTAGNTAATMQAQAELNIENMRRTQQINLDNMEESMAIQREAYERAQKLQTETSHLEAHRANLQADVMKSAAQSLGTMGSLGGGCGGMNPASAMTGMMMGGAVGSQMASMMGQMGNTINQQSAPTPPPLPQVSYMVAQNGAATGPYSIDQLSQMVQAQQLTPQSLVWKEGMANWAEAGTLSDLTQLFAPAPSSIPTPPPLP